MKKRIVWDLDGVLRNLHPMVRRKFGLLSPKEYGDWNKLGFDIYDMVEKDYSILTRAKPTKYVKVINDYIRTNKEILEIWSYQPQDWINSTTQWLKNNINCFIAHWLKPEEKYKRLMKEENTLLVDDYPNHPDYKKIILIDQPYNRHIKAKMRIKTVEDLRNKLKDLKEK